jgi:hypothetical protein
VDLAFHDASSASACPSGLAAYGIFSVRSRASHASDTPVAPVPLRCAFARAFWFGLPRPRLPPVREDRASTTTQGAFHR